MKIDTEILCSFIDGELDEQTAQTVRAALETDQNLRREYEGLQKTAQLVRSLPRVSAPPELAATITAHAERSQLLEPTQRSQSRPSRFRWTLSMAASLLVGASLGVLGYHAWPGRVAPSRAASEPVMIADAERYVPIDSPEMLASRKKTPSGKLGMDHRADTGEPSERAGGEIAAALPGRPTETPYAGKGGTRIARSGLRKGAPAKSRGGAYVDDTAMAEKRSVETEQTQELADASRAVRRRESFREEQGARDALASAGTLPKSRAKFGDTSEEALRAGITVQKALTGRKNIPLERQVRVSNVLNQDMAANLKFEAEPLNVKVVSNDSAKTLQFVQRWAQSNLLIDLNEASPKVNFPAFAQVVYQGQPGKNTGLQTKNSIFVRTTRRQAQDIVGQLQRQKPTVLSVSVKDEKKLLGTHALQPTQQQTAYVATVRELGDGDKEELKKRALELKNELAKAQDESYQKRLRAPANRYLYYLSNQAQVISLEDLVTLVVLVEDAPAAVKSRLAPTTAPPATKPSLPESQAKPK